MRPRRKRRGRNIHPEVAKDSDPVTPSFVAELSVLVPCRRACLTHPLAYIPSRFDEPSSTVDLPPLSLPTRSSGREAFHPNTSRLEVSVTKLEIG